MAQPVYAQLRKYPVRSGTYASCHNQTSHTGYGSRTSCFQASHFDFSEENVNGFRSRAPAPD
jgi:hypothetical protein